MIKTSNRKDLFFLISKGKTKCDNSTALSNFGANSWWSTGDAVWGSETQKTNSHTDSVWLQARYLVWFPSASRSHRAGQITILTIYWTLNTCHALLFTYLPSVIPQNSPMR